MRTRSLDVMIAATGGHAKNYSLMLEPDGAHHLAPMYDVASIAPYVNADDWRNKPPKLAMSIGGENRAGRVSAGNIGRMVELCGLADLGVTADGCVRLIDHHGRPVHRGARVPPLRAD